MLGNTLFISRVEHDIMFNTRNKYGISAQPCIILYILHGIILRNPHSPGYIKQLSILA